jgi:site-specific recombinase XerD
MEDGMPRNPDRAKGEKAKKGNGRPGEERRNLTPSEDLVDGFLKWLEIERNCSPLTVYEYSLDLARLSAHARDLKKKIEALTYQDLFNFLRSLRERHKCQARTLARKTAAMKSFYKWLVRSKLLEHSPAEAIESPKLPKRIPQALNQEEQERLFARLQANAYNLRGKRDNFIFHVLFYLGLRVSELTNLKFENVRKDDDGGRYVQIIGKGDKERRVPINDKAERALDAYLSVRPKTDHPYVLIALRGAHSRSRMSPRSIQKLAVKHSRALNLPPRFTPHKGRHTFVSRLIQNGADISVAAELAGHTDLQTTMIYITLRTQDKKSAVSKL